MGIKTECDKLAELNAKKPHDMAKEVRKQTDSNDR